VGLAGRRFEGLLRVFEGGFHVAEVLLVAAAGEPDAAEAGEDVDVVGTIFC
jgi:hypothetical protein